MTLTVGQLKEFLSKFDDDANVITLSHNFEMQGSMVDAKVSEGQYSEHMENFRDSFDGTRYSSKVYRTNWDNGKRTVVISG